MNIQTTAQPHGSLRWIVACISVLICMVLILSGLGHISIPGGIHTYCLMSIALCAYAWVLYSTAMSVAISVIVFLSVLWIWAVRQTAILGVDLAVLTSLLSLAAWQQRRRFRRFQRIGQVLDDLREERTVKEQAITHATRLHDALKKKQYRYAQLQTIAERLSHLTDLTGVAQLAVESAFSLIGKSDVCLLFLLDHERQELSLVASRKQDALMSIRAKHGDQFDRYILRTHRPLLVNDVRRDFRFTTLGSSERPASSVIACPILLNQSVAGVLRLDSTHPSAYTQDDLRFLDILLGLVETALANATLFDKTQQLAMTDGLTGLLLPKPFVEQLGRELLRADRSRESLSVLMLDVDHFKQYNDQYGHPAGDHVLRRIADVLRQITPPDAAIARYGGEEFLVLLPRAASEEARKVAEAIRLSIAQQSGEASAETRNAVSVSIGVVSFPEDARADLELIRIADRRLYQAKHLGRNRVCTS